LGISLGAIHLIRPKDFVMFCMPDGSMFGTAAEPPGPPLLILVTGLPFSRKATGIMTTNMHELGHLMDFGHSTRTTRSARTRRSPRIQCRQVGVPTTASMDISLHCHWMDERKQLVSTDRRGSVGCVCRHES
jgi:hypothetical protein